jgi:hypothetical protein
VIGMHFFNPVHIMQLVELVTHPRTDPALGKKSGRTILRLGEGRVAVTTRASEHRLRRQVQFDEVDGAGIVHSSWFFRYTGSDLPRGSWCVMNSTCSFRSCRSATRPSRIRAC